MHEMPFCTVYPFWQQCVCGGLESRVTVVLDDSRGSVGSACKELHVTQEWKSERRPERLIWFVMRSKCNDLMWSRQQNKGRAGTLWLKSS